MTSWLEQHLQGTAHEKKLWQDKYTNDEHFFTNLAELARQILNCGDLLDSNQQIDRIQRLAHRFYRALTSLSLRIISFIPKILEGPLARRDSAQPAASSQQQIPLFYYVSLLAIVTNERTPFTRFLEESFEFEPSWSTSMDVLAILMDDSAVSSLNTVLFNLSARPREFSDAWVTIAHVICILCRAFCRAGSEYHAGDGRVQVDNMFVAVSEWVVPAVCQKHPRALPSGFHMFMIQNMSEILQVAVLNRSMTSVLELYQAIAKAENALPCGLVDEPATEAKLKEASCDDKTVLAELIKDLWLLQVLKGYVSTDILDIKSKGIVSLRETLKSTYKIHHNGPKGSDHPVLQFLARFLRIGNFTEYIFSADSHASLVKECSDVVAFLAATGTYTDHETDLIWQACATSVEAEFVKASFEVLKVMLLYVSAQQILYMTRKYTQTSASDLGVYAAGFLTEAFAKFHSYKPDSSLQLEPMRICCDILKRLDLDPPAQATIPLRDAAMHEISALNHPQYTMDQRQVLYEICFAEIRGRTKHSTSSIAIITLFLRSLSAQEAELILELFPIQAAVDELVCFVCSSARSELSGMQAERDAVNLRLGLVLRLVGLSHFTEDKALEEQLWTYTIGGSAISSQAREDALDHFIAAPGQVKFPASVETLFQRGVNQFLPAMSADCATLRLVTFLQEKVKQAERSEAVANLGNILVDPSWQQLTRLAMATSSESVARAGILAITAVLFPKHLTSDNIHVVERQAAFVRQHMDFLHSLQEDPELARRHTSINRGITLLETILHHSKASKRQDVASGSPIELSSSEEVDRIEFTVHIHGPQSSPVARTVRAFENCHISDLGKALQSTSGVANHDLVRNGSLTRLEDILSQTLQEAGIKASSVVSIRPRYTFDCDFGKVFASTSAVESEIRLRFDDLETLLDAPAEVAERVGSLRESAARSPLTGLQVYSFLSDVSPPMSTRQRVLAPDASLEAIFPQDQPWRTLYSIHVLSCHLHECNKLGVADQQFILLGAKTLSALLLDSGRAVSGRVLLKCLPSLLDFLQERPQDSPPPPYLTQSKQLGLRLFGIIAEIQKMPFAPMPFLPDSTQPSMRAQLAKLAYAVILQMARTDGLWPEIANEGSFTDAHRSLLLSEDPTVSQLMWQVMSEFVKEKPDVAKDTYLDTLLALLPDALSTNCVTDGFFSLFRDVLQVDRGSNVDDGGIRSVIEKLVWHMQHYQHSETPDLAVMDRTFYNLLALLDHAITELKTFKQPLQLGGLAMELYDRLLFCYDPEAAAREAHETNVEAHSTTSLALRANSKDSALENGVPKPNDSAVTQTRSSSGAPNPLYHPATRAVCLHIVRRLCDNAEYHAWLLDRATRSMQYPHRGRGAWFQTGHHLKAPESSAGLTNLGMTCYMNSLLQQIYSNVEFRKFIFDSKVTDPSKQDLLSHVKLLFAEMQNASRPFVETQELARYLNISVDTQEDVHGFYTIFMSALESCLPDNAARAAFNGMFSGKLATQVQGSCGHVSSRIEPFSDLSITVQNRSSLAESLAEFVQGEPMQGANKYKCLSCDAENGGKLVDAMRRTCLEDVPDHLTVCLKRFTFDMMGQESKNNDYFEFPEEIDLSKYERQHLDSADGATQPDTFKLVGVIVHSGILTFGHYWSYVRLRYQDPNISRWVRLEDTHSRPAKGFEEVCNECFGGNNRNHNGYVLFYQRESSFEKASLTNVAIPGSALSMLPPRVDMPDDLSLIMRDKNIDHHRMVQVFDEGFHKFIVGVTVDFLTRAPEAAPKHSLPGSDSDSKSDENIVSSGASLELSLAKLAVKYVEHVLLGENLPEKMSQFLRTVQAQASAHPRLMHYLIVEICSDPSIFLQVLDHDNAEIRSMLREWMKGSFIHIREHDRDNFVYDVQAFVNAHSEQLNSIDVRHNRWLDYFSVAFDVSCQGPIGLEAVVAAPYLPWILNVAMDAPINPASHPNMPFTREAFRKGRADYSPLFQFLALVLGDWGAFDDFAHFSPGGKFATLQSLVAIPSESKVKAPQWMLLGLTQNVDPSSWDTFAPGLLIKAMTSSSADPKFRRMIGQSLIALVKRDEVFRPALFCLVAAFVEGCGDGDFSARVIGELAAGLKEHDRPPYKMAIDFFEHTWRSAPCAVLGSVGVWAPEALLPQHKSAKRAQTWLEIYIFAPKPLNEVSREQDVLGTQLDVARSRVIRSLFEQCSVHLREAIDMDDQFACPQTFTTLDSGSKYMTELVTMCNSVLEAANVARATQAASEGNGNIEETAAAASSQQDPQVSAVPKLSEAMREELKNAGRTAMLLNRLVSDFQSWGADGLVEEEGESSIFDETEDEDL